MITLLSHTEVWFLSKWPTAVLPHWRTSSLLHLAYGSKGFSLKRLLIRIPLAPLQWLGNYLLLPCCFYEVFLEKKKISRHLLSFLYCRVKPPLPSIPILLPFIVIIFCHKGKCGLLSIQSFWYSAKICCYAVCLWLTPPPECMQIQIHPLCHFVLSVTCWPWLVPHKSHGVFYWHSQAVFID